MQAQKTLLIYHRGRHGKDIEIEENTLESFERAIQEGALMVEFDVWTGLRVAHDPNDNALVPTLPEVLGRIDGRCAVNIEIKSPKALGPTVWVVNDVLARRIYTPDQIVFSAFHHKTAITMKRRFPELRIGVNNDGVLERPYIDWLASQGIDNLHLEWANIYMDIEAGCEMRTAVFENNMHIWVWTVNTRDIFDTVVAYGAEAVFTDNPPLFQ